jgi:hypothetical protein
MPIWKMERIRTLFEDWLPEPLTVATWMEKSLTIRPVCNDWAEFTASVFTLNTWN